MNNFALALDISLKLTDNATEGILSSMLSFSRLWRFARIGHALLFIHSHQDDLQHLELGSHLSSLRTAGSHRLRSLSGKLSGKRSGMLSAISSRKMGGDPGAEGSFEEPGDDAPDCVEISSVSTLQHASCKGHTDETEQQRHVKRSSVRFESAPPSSELPPPRSSPPPEPPPSPPSPRLSELQRNVQLLEEQLAAARQALEAHGGEVESSENA